MERLLEAEFEEFEDESADAKRWEMLRTKIWEFLSKISHDEEAEDADGSAGFLLQDDHDNTKTLDMEFNDLALMTRRVISGISEIVNDAAPEFEISIRVVLGDLMESLLITGKTAYIPKVKILQARFAE